MNEENVLIKACNEKDGISVMLNGEKQDIVCAFGSIITAISRALDVDAVTFALSSALATKAIIDDKTITKSVSYTEE